MVRTSLTHEEFGPYYSRYIDLVGENLSLIEALQTGKEKTIKFYQAIAEEKLTYSYDTGKWTVLEILQHLIDTERIFAYRALCIARNDKTELPGFEQDDYVKPSQANERTVASLIEEYSILRDSTIAFFKSLNNTSLKQIGVASVNPLSARAAGFIIAGHEIHHANVIETRYL